MSVKETQSRNFLSCLKNGGEMGDLTRSFNWSATALGAPEQWPQSLLTTVNIILQAKFPMVLMWGPELIHFYNDAFRPSLGDDGKHPTALGQPGEECWREIWPIIKPLIDQVMAGGEPVWLENLLTPIYRNGTIEDVYWTFSYSAVYDETGEPGGVLVICTETTEKLKTLQSAKDAKRSVEKSQAAAENERDRLTRFFMQAPAGICILDGPQLTFELVNPLYQQLFPGRELLGKSLLEAVPEIAGTAIWDVLQDVYQTGKTFEGNELLIPLARNADSPVENRYFNFIYQARFDALNNIDGILVFVIEVTEQVAFKMELAKTRDNLTMAVTSAQLGTFDMDMKKGTMDWDKRCRTLFGISHDDTVTYEKDFLPGLHPEDLDRVTKLIENVFIKAVSNGHYDVEYRTIGVEDKRMRWVRAMGKAYFDEKDVPLRFVGSVMDITERKMDEIRKNDFIGMVSHELKTPLTSLTAIIQVANAKLKNSEDTFLTGAMVKANNQVKKMSNMINGFLNISRLEAGKILIEKRKFDIDRLIADAIDEMKLTTTSHVIELRPGRPVEVKADHDKIGSVIINLLTNAVKYSPKGKKIEVGCEVIDNQVRVSVRDEGMGIKPRDLEKLFDRYYRVQTSHTQNISGFGIGLYLCAEIVERHQGTIWVESQSGIGSTFYFSLPLN